MRRRLREAPERDLAAFPSWHSPENGILLAEHFSNSEGMLALEITNPKILAQFAVAATSLAMSAVH
jgi:hypothetical protein